MQSSLYGVPLVRWHIIVMFDPFNDTKSSYQAIRKHSAAHDVYNRLHSIARDTEFVKHVSRDWYNDQFAVIRTFLR